MIDEKIVQKSIPGPYDQRLSRDQEPIRETRSSSESSLNFSSSHKEEKGISISRLSFVSRENIKNSKQYPGSKAAVLQHWFAHLWDEKSWMTRSDLSYYY